MPPSLSISSLLPSTYLVSPLFLVPFTFALMELRLVTVLGAITAATNSNSGSLASDFELSNQLLHIVLAPTPM